MKKIYLTITVAILASLSAVAQRGRNDIPDGVTIDILQNNVNKPFFLTHIQLFSGNISRYNTAFNTGMGMKAMYNKFYVAADWEMYYADGISEYMFDTGNRGSSVYKPIKSRNGSFLVGFAFAEKEVEEDITFNLKSTGNINYVTKVPGMVGKRYMAEIGFTQGFTWYGIDGYEARGKNITGGAATPASFNTNGVSTVMDYSFISLGVSKLDYCNMQVNVREFGRRSNQYLYRYYAHALLGLKNSVDDIYIQNDNLAVSGYYDRIEIDEHIEKVRLGFKLGYEMDTMDGIGFGGGFEVGYFPGLSGHTTNNLFLGFKTRLSLSKILNTL
jgi:hypothetical protein